MTINMEQIIPRPPAAPPIGFLMGKSMESVRSKKSISSSQGFRLMETTNSNNHNNNDETGSVYSIYKQKIDSMFESDVSCQTKNSVQVRIEKMFTDVSIENGIPLNDIGCHNFSVDYLGSVPLNDKVTSLSGLQQPLKELYFAYKKIVRNKEHLSGRLEISANGLKVQYQGDKGDLEQLNSFPTIAVWSAVKFVLNEDPKLSYAFLPLITDPDNIDKQQLFRTLDVSDQKFIMKETHSPLFAVVMRKIGLQKHLECHGFICQTSEDAIVIAATLYKALMTHMNYKEKKPKNRNGVTCMSVASSMYNEISLNKNQNQIPIRPPRKKRSSISSVTSDRDLDLSSDTTKTLMNDVNQTPKKSIKNKRAPNVPNDDKIDLDAIVPYEELNDNINDDEQCHNDEIKPKPLGSNWNTYINKQQKQITDEIKQVLTESTNMGLKRVKSLRRRNEEGLNKSENSGDILTKVTIPRSGSFLNAGGLTRYKSKMNRANGQATGGSPLGFNELFNEFRLQEGLHSMDEILGVIIDPEGMSFNDLKPIYKEFLLKLAVTLTKDELYQRSKAIMRRQKKKLLRRNSNLKNNHVVCTKFKRLKYVFQKIRNKKISKLNGQNVANYLNDESKIPESSLSSSSYDTRQFRPKPQTNVTRKQSYRRRANEMKLRRERASTSEESDFFSLRRPKSRMNFDSKNQNKNSSSGYVSCSECSYDSDTCTCVSADKCYCSLGDRNIVKMNKSQKNSLHPEKCYCSLESKCYCSIPIEKGSLTWCGCDTDSCAESNKCYCMTQGKSTIFEQLKQRGFIPSIPSESITTPPKHRKLCKKNSNTKSTKSLEYMANPAEHLYFEKLAKSGDNRRRNSDLGLDYDLFNVDNHLHRNGVYNTSLRTDFKGAYSKYQKNGKMVKSTAIPARECDEALSVKKSAEIAALFSDIKLSQTTDISQLLPKNSSRNYTQIATHKYTKIDKSTLKSDKLFNASHTNRNNANTNHNICNNNKNGMKNNGNMYSTRNGLYTIQSQSDDSRRSSISDNIKRVENVKEKDFFGLEKSYDLRKSSSNSCNLENSLGYLP